MAIVCLMLKLESPVLVLFPPWYFNQLGVEFGSKLITLPDDNKVVKLQCEFEAVDLLACAVSLQC
jgi:hypothetical protein